MLNHCTRCGYYVDPAEKFCLGCGGNLVTLRQRYPVDDPLSRLGDAVARHPVASKPAPKVAPAPAPKAAAPRSQPSTPVRPAPRAPSFDLGAPTPPVSPGRSLEASDDLSLDASGDLALPGTDFADGASAGDGLGDLDFASLGPTPSSGKPSSMQLFDLDADVGGPTAAISGGPAPRRPAAAPLDSDAGSLPTLSFDPSSIQSGVNPTLPGARARAAESGSEVYDLDAQLGGATPAAASGEASDIDFSALSGPGAAGSGGGDVDFSNLSTIENSQSGESGGDALDLSLSNFGGGLGELDFSSLVQDASGPSSGHGEAIDFSGLSSIEVAPPAGAPPAAPAAGERPSDDVVYDLDLDGAAGGGLGGGSGLGLDDKDVSAMEEDLLKASIISYKPGGPKKK